MPAHRVIALTVFTVLATPLAARAQTAPDTAFGVHGLCWMRPAPACGTLLLTNFGVYQDYPQDNSVNGTRLEWDLGLMANVTRRDAVGGSLFFLTDRNGRFSEGLALRYRRWLGGENSVEAAVGVRGGAELIDKGAMVAMIKYNFGPKFGVVLRPELLFSCPQYGGVCARTDASSRLRVAVGVELGSWLGVASSAALGLVAAVVSAAMPHIM